MFALCIESSHTRGMGHLFRAFNIIEYLNYKNEDYILLINYDENSINILKDKNITFETVDFSDTDSDWETVIIQKYNIDIWINDKFVSDKRFSYNIKKNNVFLVTLDDIGDGAELADLHFAGVIGIGDTELKGKVILKGKDYIIMNQEIIQYRRLRKTLKKIIVTLGGSDTYGATVKVAKILIKLNINADIIIGPSFQHSKELDNVVKGKFKIYKNVPSLIKMFFDYDLAITGGGFTCYEAAASGLPCVIIANEIHEIKTGKYLEDLGNSIFAGYHENIDENKFDFKSIDVAEMSNKALLQFNLNGMENIYNRILDFNKKFRQGLL